MALRNNGEINMTRFSSRSMMTRSTSTSSLTHSDFGMGGTPQFRGPFCCISCLKGYNEIDEADTLVGNAFDVIMVESKDKKLYQNSEFLCSFRIPFNPRDHKMILEIRGDSNISIGDDYDYDTTIHPRKHQSNSAKAWFPITRLRETTKQTTNFESVDDAAVVIDDDDDDDDYFANTNDACGCCHHHHPMTTSASPGIITDINGTIQEHEIASKFAPFLQPGKNPIRYLLLDKERIIGVAYANIFLWSYRDKVIVFDIDGTITKSNARGVLDTILTEKYKYCHEGVCKLVTMFHQQPWTQIVYLTSRPIGLASPTRKFLANVRQESEQLPEGPLLGFGGNLPQLLLMELVSMNTHQFKARVLWNQVVQPFLQIHTNNSPSSWSSIFMAGFGNTFMDAQAYHMAGIDWDKIYIIDKKSQIAVLDKQEPVREMKDFKNPELLIPPTVGVPMPRSWYKSKVGTVFNGYTDLMLSSHVMRRRKEDYDSIQAIE